MQISDFAKVARIGPIIDFPDNPSEWLSELASEVQSNKATLEFQAQTASGAAAWLLLLAHANALGTLSSKHEPQLRRLFPFKPNSLFGFRGQRIHYPTLIPSIAHSRVTASERAVHNRAFAWFHAAISAWHNTHFRYFESGLDTGGIEVETAIGVAQHYGIRTFFIDWSWDPLVAIAFAIQGLCAGQTAAVYIRQFAADGSRANNIQLPPSFARRVWKQRGFFACHPVMPEHWGAPEVRLIAGRLPEYLAQASTYHRIVFDVDQKDIAWASETMASLYEEDEGLPLTDLADWSLKTAASGHEISWYIVKVMSESDFRKQCEKFKLDLPALFNATPSIVTERVSEMMDYIELVTVRNNPETGVLAYHIPALLTLTAGMPWCSFPNDPGPAAGLEDSRASLFFTGSRMRACDLWAEQWRRWQVVKSQYAVRDNLYVDRTRLRSLELGG